MGKAFIHLGLRPGHGVGIIGFNSPEWFFAGLFISRSSDVSSHVSGASSLKKLRALGSNCLVTWLWVKYITTNVLDIGCVFAGGLASGIYPTNSAEACK